MTETTSSDRAIREIPLAPGGAVEVSLTSNELRLRGADTDRVVVRTRDGEAIDDHIVIEPFADGVRIKDAVADFRLGPLRIATRGTADLDIEVPRTARVSVRTLSGDVDASGIGAGSRWASASGDLRLRIEGGEVAAESMSGDITIDSPTRIEATVLSVSGDVRIRAPELASLRVSTTSGDVDVAAALAVGPEHKINAVSGDVQLATGSQVRLEAQTLTGDVRSTVKHRAEGGRGRRTLVVGDGRVHVTVRTMSGDVRLREGPAAPATPPPVPVNAATHAGPASPQNPPADPGVVVAEAAAAPNLVRADAPPTTGSVTGTESQADRGEAARLDILRALERGELDIETASSRLAAIDDAGPRHYRGWF